MGPTTFLHVSLVKFCSVPAFSLLFRAAGRGGGQADAGYSKNKANLSLQAKLDLKLRLSLAIRLIWNLRFNYKMQQITFLFVAIFMGMCHKMGKHLHLLQI